MKREIVAAIHRTQPQLQRMNYFLLGIAILAEVVATSFLKASNGFSRTGQSIAVIAGYCIAFYCLSLTLRTIPLGIAYAIWSGVGVALVTLVGWLLYEQRLDFPAIFGIGLIAAGVIVLNVFSKASVR
jgi:small multidrug resistance pump